MQNYVELITNSNSPDYIPPEDRIAIFDFDGTIFGELFPTYFDYLVYITRVLKDSTYKANDEEIQLAKDLLATAGHTPYSKDKEHSLNYPKAFKGMSLKDYQNFIRKLKEEPADGVTNLKRGSCFYKPMIEIINYLKANQFIIFLVSGCDRYVIRTLVENSPIDLPVNHVIGSDLVLMGTHQDDNVSGWEYQFKDDDEVVIGASLLIKNNGTNKIASIIKEIGKKPILSFGNGSSDCSMTKYITVKNKYKAMGFFVVNNDDVREYGGEHISKKLKNLVESNGWVPIYMKEDWKTIYGDDVHITKTK